MTDETWVGPWADFQGHEQIVVAQDPASGLRAMIALHSTCLGPALGGVRMSTYADAANPQVAAYRDALNLSRAMSYKNALAGLDHGGGKAVILSDPAGKTPELLHAFGRLVESLDGRYLTAGDVGMSVADMDVIGQSCRWTTGMSEERGGLGDSGILTAVGVWQGIRACATHVWGAPDLADRRILVIGAGKVGGRLVGHLVGEGAIITVVDPDSGALELVAGRHPDVRCGTSLDAVINEDWDVLSPNALGGLLTHEAVPRLRTQVICGGANNQLADASVAGALAEAGILYAPDFLVNCGGVIQVAEEALSGDLEQARAKVLRVFETTERVLSRARDTGITPLAAAEAEAEDRMADTRVGRASEQVG